MGKTSSIQPPATALKKALLWVGDTLREHPEKSRQNVLREAAIRFDLTPRECEFIEQTLDKQPC
ncbi:MAG: hypothetical protein BWK76_27340 [Desulfobulbaceae bacterium A2]|nr:MAG: hypothetical protein BWK76_27340 [Desulfobulbaceae bacterium A2]